MILNGSLVCDVTRPATMEALRSWKKEIDKVCDYIPTRFGKVLTLSHINTFPFQDLIEEAKRNGTKVQILILPGFEIITDFASIFFFDMLLFCCLWYMLDF